MNSEPSVYAYEGLNFEVHPGVFSPNKTTELLLEAVLRNPVEGKSALDLGCGCGIVGIVVTKNGRLGRGCGSDISGVAVENAKANARKLGVEMDLREGSLFEPWGDEKFDMIMHDVSGLAEPIARLSPWYPPEIHSEAGLDGTAWISKVLEEATLHLNTGGVLYFATASLSNEVKILEKARSRFPRVECLLKKSWPFREDFWQKLMSNETARRLIEQGVVKVIQKGRRFLWDTSIYMACF